MNESSLQNKCLRYLQQIEDGGGPLIFFRRDATGRTYKKGLPDIFIIVGPYHLEVELKDKGGTASSMQLIWERKFKGVGTPYLRTDDFNEFKSFVETYLQKIKAES